jgi:hypothetical protein
MEQPNTILINNKEYKLEDLDEKARSQLLSIQMCDKEIARLGTQLAIVKTAKMAYSRALVEAVGADEQ